MPNFNNKPLSEDEIREYLKKKSFNFSPSDKGKFVIVQKQKNMSPFDGTTGKGFVMRVIPETFSDFENGIKNPFNGIVSFKAFTCFYSK